MIRNLSRRLSAYLLFVASVFASPPPGIQKALDQWIQGQPGGIALVWVDANGPAFFQAGRTDGADSAAITPDTVFEIGSETKVFTALLLAESERQGRVNRNDPVAKYLLPAEDPAQATLARITLLSLTTHTSGLPRMPTNFLGSGSARSDPYAHYDRALLVQALRDEGARADEGKRMDYSNLGAALLGEALGVAWGTSYADALREHVLQPLGLHATTVGLAGQQPPPNLAPGHVGGKRVPNWTFEAFAPAGALRSTARDMAIFLAACLGQGNAPLREAFATTEQPERTAVTHGQIGMAWMIHREGSRIVYWHNGATAGSHAYVAFCPQLGRGVALLANVQKPSEDLGYALLTTGAVHISHPEEITLPVETLREYVGRYPLGPGVAATMTEENGRLFTQLSGQRKFPLFASAKDHFFLKVVNAQLSFERDARGQVTGVTLHQNGMDQSAPREPLPAPAAEITLPVETLREYVGQYALAPSFILTVTEEGGALYTQATGQPKIPVFASAKDEFFLKVVEARLSFQRDGSGKVTGLVLHQNGQDLPAAKAP